MDFIIALTLALSDKNGYYTAMQLFEKPFFITIKGNIPGKTLLITAGMDGDEYTGIDAAYQLITMYKHMLKKGTLIIIPIVNQNGNKQRVSWNPSDKKYPKHILPGNEHGSATEQLMHWIYKTYIAKHSVDLWIDLHAGASNETLYPFVLGHETKNQSVNKITKQLLKALTAPLVVYEKNTRSAIPTVTAIHTIPYIMFESGELGQRNVAATNQHIRWAKQIITTFLYEKKQRQKTHSIFRRIKEYYSPTRGVWHPYQLRKNIKKDDVLGHIVSFDGKKTIPVTSEESGRYLWGKHDPYCDKKEFLFAIAQEKAIL